MKNVNTRFAAALLCLLALIGFEHYRISSVKPGGKILFGATNTESGNNTHRLDQHNGPTSAVAFNSQKATGLANATTSGDAVPFNQLVTTAANGIALATDRSLMNKFFTEGFPSIAVEYDDFVGGGTIAAGSSTLVTGTVFGQLQWRVTLANSGTLTLVSTAQDSTHRGIVQMRTTASTSSFVSFVRFASGGPLNDTFGSGQAWCGMGRVRFPALSNGTDRFVFRAPFINSGSAAPSDGLYVEYSDNITSGNWNCVGMKASSGTNATGGSTLAVAANTWYTFYTCEDTAGNGSCRVNGTNLGSVAAASMATNATSEGASLQRVLGTANADALVDGLGFILDSSGNP